MKRRTALPELLAPAGSFDALVAAVRAGADAVYVGGKSFGARAYAKNFDTEELERAISYCHLHGVKLYVTLNTLIYDREIEEFAAFVRSLRSLAPDALIMADLGAIALVRRLAPELEIHASTQMGVHNTEGADAAYRLGCKRVVLARELSRKNICSVTEKCLAETEVFLHGALCVCHSGQCLFSSLVGGRSGNRGECAQPCRLPYNDKYPLSLRDLSLAAHIKELIESGVASLKIEGRMKSADYVYTVTSIYRRLLDEARGASEEEKRALEKAFSRGGFTDGYFGAKLSSGMTGVRSEEDKKEARDAEKLDFSPDRVKLTAKASFRLGEPSRLTLMLNGVSAVAEGAMPTRAQNAPLTQEALRERLSKMGNTFFSLEGEDIEIELDEGINLSPAQINALRRDAAASLVDAREELPDIELPEKPAPVQEKRINTALFFRPELISALGEDKRMFDIIFVPLMSEGADFSIANGVYLPPVIMDDEWDEVISALRSARACGVRYALVGNLSHISAAQYIGLVPIGDFRLNICNSHSREAYRLLGVETALLSPEPSLAAARDIGGGEIVFGRIPLMLTERCFIKENFGCDVCGKAVFSDRTGARFPVIREWRHRNVILNSTPTYMGDKKKELDLFGIGMRHFVFTVESSAEINSLLRKYKSGEPFDGARRIGKRENKDKRRERTDAERVNNRRKNQTSPAKFDPSGRKRKK